MGVNLFEFENADQKDFLIQEAFNMLQNYCFNHQGIDGPTLRAPCLGKLPH